MDPVFVIWIIQAYLDRFRASISLFRLFLFVHASAK